MDDCVTGHGCMAEEEIADCLSGLVHRYKMEPEDPLADSQGSTPLVQEPRMEAGQRYLYSRLDCMEKDEACLHWSPQPTLPKSQWHAPNNIYLQIPLAELEPTDGITVTFLYKRWTENKFGPRQRNLLCLRNATAVTTTSTESNCIWSLVLTSALETQLATQVVALHPAGFFSSSAINILDVERWYHICLVISKQNTARLYIDHQQLGPPLFLEWDASLYQTQNMLELEIIQAEARADIMVWTRPHPPLGVPQRAAAFLPS